MSTRKEIQFLLIESDTECIKHFEHSFDKLKILNPLYRVGTAFDALKALKSKEESILYSPLIIFLSDHKRDTSPSLLLEQMNSNEVLQRIPVFLLQSEQSQLMRNDSKLEYPNIAGILPNPLNKENLLQAIHSLNVFWNLIEKNQLNQKKSSVNENILEDGLRGPELI